MPSLTNPSKRPPRRQLAVPCIKHGGIEAEQCSPTKQKNIEIGVSYTIQRYRRQLAAATSV